MNNLKKLLLLDFSGVAHATYHAMGDEFETDEEKIKCWKFIMLNSIKKNKLKHNPSEFVICADSFSWRKKIFPFYKGRRAKIKEESKIDYVQFMEKYNEFLEEIDKYFPYKVLKVNGAEADDLIAIISETFKTDFDRVIIASNDKDFRQLIRDNIHLWNLRDEKFIQINDRQEYLVSHILSGDSGDDVPNVRSDDDVFIVDGKRQKPCGPKTIVKILQEGIESWFETQWAKEIAADEKLKGKPNYQNLKSKPNQLKRNWKRNKKLIELSRSSIPTGLWNVVVEKYNKLENKKSNYSSIVGYLTKKRFRQLINDANMFMMKNN